MDGKFVIIAFAEATFLLKSKWVQGGQIFLGIKKEPSIGQFLHKQWYI